MRPVRESEGLLIPPGVCTPFDVGSGGLEVFELLGEDLKLGFDRLFPEPLEAR